ncbi:hypothetical protein DNTS_021075 [Danionella cerebrum]|uniref:[histone H3]-trimethyl-L-lysine(4) demethylase n=1 Tax=Danionella cerebrum TaxID=2873325 RepID=A0A553Q287_9TELE|nr:hypothetical protein DNTS_021075 [Danionella translucida]
MLQSLEECPVLEPDWREFGDPLGFIVRVREITERTGLCRIRPPQGWEPPFTCDEHSLRFTPRVQNLNQPEARCVFLEALFVFWKRRGSELQIPHMEGRALDLYLLAQLVSMEGGYEQVCKQKIWSKISKLMGFSQSQRVLSVLRGHYRRILQPYTSLMDISSEAEDAEEEEEKDAEDEEKLSRDEKNEDGVQVDAGGVELLCGSGSESVTTDEDSWLRRQKLLKAQAFAMKMRPCKPRLELNYVELCLCRVCGRSNEECDDSGLSPVSLQEPRGDWSCPKCVKQEATDGLCFQPSVHEHTLQSYGEMADRFKADYFNMPVHEFWRLVGSLEDCVWVEQVELSAKDHGSGFPEYSCSGWNLNNLPSLDQCVLAHCSGELESMKVPRLEVGMAFSSSPWRQEHHWSSLISFLHWGEGRTWYSVPARAAEPMERVMREVCPELFKSQPDLLFHLLMHTNPGLLVERGLFRANQIAGEFVITAPRAYHCSFNQGFNFSEAVNFCTADWLPMGKQCVSEYRRMQQSCLFSHEELVFRMAATAESLDVELAVAVQGQLEELIKEERVLRENVTQMGNLPQQQEVFELLPEEDRRCCYCRTICFLSALSCSCCPQRLVCLYHSEHLCSCAHSSRTLRFRYDQEEYSAMLSGVQSRAQSYEFWAKRVTEALDPDTKNKKDLLELQVLVEEAEEKRFSERNSLLQRLRESLKQLETCGAAAQLLLRHTYSLRERPESDTQSIRTNLTVEELSLFVEQLDRLPCIIKLFLSRARCSLSTLDSGELKALLSLAAGLPLVLPERVRIRLALRQACWQDEVALALRDSNPLTLERLRALMEAGVALAPHPLLEKSLAELQELMELAQHWEERARVSLQARPRLSLQILESVVSEAQGIPAFLPNVLALREALSRAREWKARVQSIQSGNSVACLEQLEALLSRGRSIPVKLEQLSQVEEQVEAARAWRERAARSFLKKNSTHTLLQVLSPRMDVGVYSGSGSGSSRSRRRQRARDQLDQEGSGTSEHRDEWGSEQQDEWRESDPAEAASTLRAQARAELLAMRALRTRNQAKALLLDQSPLPLQSQAQFCLCRRPPSGLMLQCQLCRDWLHATCVPPARSGLTRRGGAGVPREGRFLCPRCQRSRRPRLETVLSLLVALQKLPVRLPEGTALQGLTERAMGWQDRARRALATPELSSALAQLSLLSQRMVEQAAREKTQKIIHAELKKAAANPDLQAPGFSRSTSPRVSVDFDDEETDSDEDDPGEVKPYLFCDEEIPVKSEEVVTHMWPSSSTPSFCSEHAYSSASKSCAQMPLPPGSLQSSGSSSGWRKQPRKSALVPRRLDGPVLQLSVAAQETLQELMMEGDLLEATLEESQHLWRILQASEQQPQDRLLTQPEATGMEKPLRLKGKQVEKKKKRRLELLLEGRAKPKKKKLKLSPDRSIKQLARRLERERKRRHRSAINNAGTGLDTLPTPADPLDQTGSRKVLDIPSKYEWSGAEDSSDENAVCAAPDCLRPCRDKVDWVQCDGGCDEWFHQVCVGVSCEMAENEDYICSTCSLTHSTGATIETSSEPPEIQSG